MKQEMEFQTLIKLKQIQKCESTVPGVGVSSAANDIGGANNVTSVQSTPSLSSTPKWKLRWKAKPELNNLWQMWIKVHDSQVPLVRKGKTDHQKTAQKAEQGN